MDLSNMFGNLKNKIGGAMLPEDIKKQMAEMGITPDNMDGMIGKVKEMIASGKISKEELSAKANELAKGKGIPQSVIDAAMKMLDEK